MDWQGESVEEDPQREEERLVCGGLGCSEEVGEWQVEHQAGAIRGGEGWAAGLEGELGARWLPVFSPGVGFGFETNVVRQGWATRQVTVLGESSQLGVVRGRPRELQRVGLSALQLGTCAGGPPQRRAARRLEQDELNLGGERGQT